VLSIVQKGLKLRLEFATAPRSAHHARLARRPAPHSQAAHPADCEGTLRQIGLQSITFASSATGPNTQTASSPARRRAKATVGSEIDAGACWSEKKHNAAIQPRKTAMLAKILILLTLAMILVSLFSALALLFKSDDAANANGSCRR
jgi:hypothetical protein